MRDQLDVERRRRRDVTDRQLITDIARIGGPNYVGMRSGGYHSVLPGDNIDSGPGGHRYAKDLNIKLNFILIDSFVRPLRQIH